MSFRMELRGSKTEQNIKAAFTGEAVARGRYSAFAQGARDEGNEEVAQLFESMSENEKEHAKLWYRIFHGGYGAYLDNLQTAADNENFEWKSMYPDFAKKAREEGFEDIAILFDRIAAIEYDHERRFTEMLIKLTSDGANAEKGVAKLQEEDKFYCMFCGNISNEKLAICPVCGGKDSLI